MMYKRIKGLGKTKKDVKGKDCEEVGRALELMEEDAQAISLVASPRTRISELKAIFHTEYPELDFDAVGDSAAGGE